MKSVNRRSFIGGVAAALGYAGLSPFELAAQRRGGAAQAVADPTKPKLTPDEAFAKAALDYDKMAKLANNENPYGPSEAVLKAMNDAWKYANRYGYPDPGIRDAIAEHHGVKPENILISAGSSEILKAVDDTYVPEHRKIVGADPTYASVYQYATNSRGQAVRVALKKDYNQDIDAMIHATKLHSRDVGLVYICNPNNPTGRIVPKEDIKKLFDNTPEEIPVLIDEAYHHFVDNPAYETSIKYVLEGRRVIVARTFSKIAALAGMRLGFAIAPKDMIAEMQQTMVGSGYTVNAIVRFGGVAALKDTAHEAKMKSMNKQVRDSTLASLKTMDGKSFRRIPTSLWLTSIRMSSRLPKTLRKRTSWWPQVPTDGRMAPSLCRIGRGNEAFPRRLQGDFPGTAKAHSNDGGSRSGWSITSSQYFSNIRGGHRPPLFIGVHFGGYEALSDVRPSGICRMESRAGRDESFTRPSSAIPSDPQSSAHFAGNSFWTCMREYCDSAFTTSPCGAGLSRACFPKPGSTGEEAVTIGNVHALDRKRDLVGPMIRNAGACHEMGMSIANMLREYLATGDSPSHGKDLHIGDMDHGVIAPASQVAALVPGVCRHCIDIQATR